MSMEDNNQGQLNKLWKGTLASPDRPSLIYGHCTIPIKVIITVQGYTVTVQQYIWMHHLQNQSKSATTIATQKPVLPIFLDQRDHNWPRNAAIWDVTFCPHVT